VKELMKRTAKLLTLATALFLGACGGDSKLPTASGKATITAINAIHGSPSINVLIEERSLGVAAYKSTTTSASYDDLDYTFNFDVFFAGDTALTRIASQHIDFVADQHYTILATGTLADTVLTVWETPKREFADTDTVFQARFSHTSDFYGGISIDIYFALAGVAPAAGEAAATLAFGEISEAMDFEADDYVVTITTSGDPADILFTSSASTMLARSNLVITPFDGDENDTAPLVVRGVGAFGGTIAFDDPSYPATMQFLHAAMDMNEGIGTGASDIFDDEGLSSLVVANHAFRDLTADTAVAPGAYQFLYTPAGDTSMISLDTAFSAGEGVHYRITAIGTGGEYSTFNTILDRRSVDTAGKLLYFQSSNNFDASDIYLVDPDTTIDGVAPFRLGVLSRLPNAPFEVVPGIYDLYITDFLGSETLAGPFRLDIAAGDVVDMAVFDTADPAVLEIVVYPNP